MDVHFSEDQELLRDTARSFLQRECTMDRVRAQMDDPVGHPTAIWEQMAKLGWLGLVVPEAYSGSALDMVDQAILCEEMGRCLLPGAYLSTAVIAAQALQRGGSTALAAEHLPPLARGERRFALAQLEPGGGPDAAGIQLAARAEGEDFLLRGCKTFVHDGPSADWLLVPARTRAGADSDGITLLLVDASAPGVEQQPIRSIEPIRKLSEIRFDDVRVPAWQRLGAVDAGWPLLMAVLDHAKVALCAEMAGGAGRVLELSVAYAKTRQQFGQPIGRFQAIQHRCANMLIRSEGMKSAAYYAAWSVAAGQPHAHLSACLALSYCADQYASVAGDGIQIHGGLGFTWEQDLHLYFKHAMAAAARFGSASHNRELAARVAIDGETL